LLTTGAVAIALAAVSGLALPDGRLGLKMTASAQGAGHGQGGSDNRGGANAGGQGQGGPSSGQGGPSEDSPGRGPQAGPNPDAGGQPVWAAEGIPEVELGRLNVARSPEHVLDRAFDEVLANFTPEMAAFYSLSLSEMITRLSLEWDELTIVDSPLQNLSLLRDALHGTSALSTVGVTNDHDTLLAVFLGVASDKVVPISTDTVIALTMILGTPITGTDAAALAADAEAIRIAVLAGHG
jgi:hypothetical protein